MTGIVVLILRILLAGALYAFLGWGIYVLWRDLRRQSALAGERRIPAVRLSWQADHQEQSREYRTPQVIIGRDPNSDCPLPDDTISARHARLAFHHKQWWLEDLRSKNGTFLNQSRLDTPVVIVSGDELRCGQVYLTISILEQ